MVPCGGMRSSSSGAAAVTAAAPLASIVDEKVRRVADLSRKMGALGMPIEVSTTKKRTS